VDDLPLIPRHIWTRDPAPAFCQWGDEWAVIGADSELSAHGEVAVWQRTSGRHVRIATGRYLAARVVRHQSGSLTSLVQGESTRYVVVAIRERLVWAEGDIATSKIDEPS
jgi:hypothetical protein